jgi:hypothetical protein|tara:strand:+ start:3438 stop:3686 length:249 start_codon:yes stop_codon:yes gene_type:complete
MTHKERLFKALKSECEADINEALLTMDMCFTKAAAIGEHTSGHFLQEAMKALEKLTDGRDKLDTLEQYYNASSIFNKKQLLG